MNLGVVEVEPRTWKAPSRDNAILWLRAHLEFPGMTADIDPVEGGYRFTAPRKMLFRGQRDSSWPVVTQLQRVTDPALRAKEEEAAQLFAEVALAEMKQLLQRDGYEDFPPPEEMSGLAAAQHYGMKTDLLDWSTNVMVAAFFATHKPDITAPDALESAIYWIDILEAEKNGLHVVLPPPHVKRLHLQRGVFIEYSEHPRSDLASLVHRIVFPHSSKPVILGRPDPQDPTQVIALGDHELLEIDDWFDRLAKWASLNAGKVPIGQAAPGQTVPRSYIQFIMAHGYHPYCLGELPFLMVDEYAMSMFGLIDQLVLRNHSQGTVYHPQTAKMLAAHNPALFGWLETNFRDATFHQSSPEFLKTPADVSRLKWLVTAST